MTIFFYGTTAVLLLWSVAKSRAKTRDGIKFSFSMLKGMLLQILCILALLALLLALIPQESIAAVLGGDSAFLSVLWGALIGTVTIIPGVIAFPLAGNLVGSGASLPAVAAFITTLTMVGFATLPIEIKAFGRRFALWRNGLSLVFALVIAMLMGLVI